MTTWATAWLGKRSSAAARCSSTAAPARSCGGAACRSTPRTWSALASLTHYELLRAIHADYIDAGADVITTNTFATTRFVLEAAGHGDDFAAINARAVAAAREARDASGARRRDRGLDLVPAAALRRARLSRRARRERRVPRARRDARRSRRRLLAARDDARDAARAARLRRGAQPSACRSGSA